MVEQFPISKPKRERYKAKGVWIEQGRPSKYTKDWWIKAKQYQIDFINEDELEVFESKCKTRQQRLCVVILYYSGCRPAEILPQRFYSDHIWYIKERNTIALSLPTLKGGIGRTIFLPVNKHTQVLMEFIEFASDKTRFPVFTEFKHVWNIRDLIYKITDNKYTAYFFRHNRFSKLAKAGIPKETIKYFKGAKSDASVTTYLHLGGTEVKDIVDKID